MLAAQTGNMVNILAGAISEAGGRKLILGPGVFVIEAANPSLPLGDYSCIEGSGRGNTIIEFRGLSGSSHGFAAQNKVGIRLSGLTIRAASPLTSNQNAVNFESCNDCVLEDVEQVNFSGGFWFTNADGPNDLWGHRNKAIRCVSRLSRSYGFFSSAGTANEWSGCEAYGATNLDGFKTGYGNRGMRITGCYASGNNKDGFDTYDGFVASVMSDCVAENNLAAGFQIKGTLGGEYSAGDYVSRESSIANCVARGNAISGFLFQESRAITLSGLTASGNGGSGFVFNNTQSIVGTSLLSIRNAQDGFNLQGNASYNTFGACIAQDNSYTDGTSKSGMHHGFNLAAAGSNTFFGCQSYNGNQPGKVGGQGDGFHVESASVGNTFGSCRAFGNVAGNAVPL